MSAPATPTFSLASGIYIGVQQTSIYETTAGATVHYTTDGSVPTSSSPVYSSQLTISTSVTILAIAILGIESSEIASATYSIIILPERIDLLQKKLFAVMPPYQGTITGPRVGRTRIYAAAMAGSPWMLTQSPSDPPAPIQMPAILYGATLLVDWITLAAMSGNLSITSDGQTIVVFDTGLGTIGEMSTATSFGSFASWLNLNQPQPLGYPDPVWQYDSVLNYFYATTADTTYNASISFATGSLADTMGLSLASGAEIDQDNGPVNPGLETQLKLALQQLSLGASLIRQPVHLVGGTVPVTDPGYDPSDPSFVDPSNWDLNLVASWIFEAATNPTPGAADVFLTMWGNILQVPRVLNESDSHYAQKILLEVVMPCTNNIGMAILIDFMLGVTGTKVIDTWELLNYQIRLNDGHRSNNGLRLAMENIFGIPTTFCTFFVSLPQDFVDGEINGFSNDDINNFIARRKASGFRKIATLTPSANYPDQ